MSSPYSQEDDLDYMHARFFSPTTGRLLQVDPQVGSIITPQSWNRFAYVAGNPLRWVDPTGMKLEIEGDTSGVQEIANGTLFGEDLVITGNDAKLVPTSEVGPPTRAAAALSATLSDAIDRKETVKINAVSGDSEVIVGSYQLNSIDTADMKAARGRVVSPGALLAHEIAEQTAKQVLGLGNDWIFSRAAHGFGQRAQATVSGFTPGYPPRAMLEDGTGAIRNTHTRGTEKITATMIVVRGNVLGVLEH